MSVLGTSTLTKQNNTQLFLHTCQTFSCETLMFCGACFTVLDNAGHAVPIAGSLDDVHAEAVNKRTHFRETKF